MSATGTGNQAAGAGTNVNLTQIGGTVQSGANVVDVPNTALRVNVVAGGTGGGAVTIADAADVAQGATTDAAVITDTSGTLSGKIRGLVKWAFERMPASLGQKAMAASLPVTLASDQTALSVSLAANQSVNVAQVNGTTTLAGSGDVGSGAQRITEAGNPTITTGQVAVAASATSIVSARAGRQAVLITNLSAVDIYLGPSGVATNTGTLLLGTKGTSISFPSSAAIFGISSTGTNTVTFAEIY